MKPILVATMFFYFSMLPSFAGRLSSSKLSKIEILKLSKQVLEENGFAFLETVSEAEKDDEARGSVEDVLEEKVEEAAVEKAGTKTENAEKEKSDLLRTVEVNGKRIELDAWDAVRKIGILIRVEPTNAVWGRGVPEPDVTSEDFLALELAKMRGELYVIAIEQSDYSWLLVQEMNQRAQRNDASENVRDECVVSKEMLEGRLRRQIQMHADFMIERKLFVVDDDVKSTALEKKTPVDLFLEEIDEELAGKDE